MEHGSISYSRRFKSTGNGEIIQGFQFQSISINTGKFFETVILDHGLNSYIKQL